MEDDETYDERIEERGNAADLIGTVTCTDAAGNPIPVLDEDGMEILGIANGSLYVDPAGAERIDSKE